MVPLKCRVPTIVPVESRGADGTRSSAGTGTIAGPALIVPAWALRSPPIMPVHIFYTPGLANLLVVLPYTYPYDCNEWVL